MRNVIIILAGLLMCAAMANAATTKLDPQTPVTVEGNTVIYEDQTYTLGPGQLLVDGQLTDAEAAESPYVFNDARKALQSIEFEAVTVLFAPGVYWLDDPDDDAVRTAATGVPYAVEVKCRSLVLQALASKPENVVLAVNRGQTQGAIGNYTMMHFTGERITMRGLTFGNFCNVDLAFPLAPQYNRERRARAIVQAQIGICSGTSRMLADNCRFLSRLNLCPFVGARRSVYNNCYFECTDDALTGSAVYHGCRFTFFSGKPFYNTCPTGAVLLNCDIDTHVTGTQYISKVPAVSTLIDVRFRTLYDAAASPLKLQWYRDMGPEICYQSGVTLNGNPVTVDADRKQLSVDLTKAPLLAAYKLTKDGKTVYNVYNLVCGDDGWDPLEQAGEIAAMGGETDIPVVMRFAPQSFDMKAEGDVQTVTQQYLRWGGYDFTPDARNGAAMKTLAWHFNSSVKVAQGREADTFECTSNNHYARSVDALVTATTHYGWAGAFEAKIAPKLNDAPKFSAAPALTLDKKKHTVQVTYALDAAGDDRSRVMWYRFTDPGKMDTVPVIHGTIGTHGLYKLCKADRDCYLMVRVIPQLADSHAGEAVTAVLAEPVKHTDIGLLLADEKKMHTDFAEVPVVYQPKAMPGVWAFDAYKPADTERYDWSVTEGRCPWYYGTGVDGAADVTGLVQKDRGARAFYKPLRETCKDMSVTWVLNPAKTAGQGFGSATGQYMDLYIKFAPETMSGYALRIERTPDYDRAVTFTLVRYDNGKVTPITTPQASSCFVTPCTVTVKLAGNTLTATATTTKQITGSALAPKPEATTVNLTVPVANEKNGRTALGVQHTGSTGASATLISSVDAEWK